MKTILKSITTILVSVAVIHAQVPPLLNIQGRLTDPNGVNRPNGPIQMIFRVYDQSTGGTKLWEETQPAVNIKNGIFQVFLGQEPLPPGGNPIEAVFNGQDRFLEMQVAGDPPMVPRQRMVSVPFALSAEQAHRAEVLGDNQVIVTPTGNVGIGLSIPVQRLHVNGNVAVDGAMGIGTSNPQAGVEITRGGGLPGLIVTKVAGPEPVASFRSNGTELMRLERSGNTFFTGNIGIGSGPGAGLEITRGGGVPGLIVRKIGGTENVAEFYGDSGSDARHVFITRSGGFDITSDLRLKSNVTTITSVLEQLSTIRGVYFTWANHISEGRQIGIIAQELEQPYPELVSVDSSENAYKSVDYTRFTAVLLEGIKELNATVEAQQNKIQELESRLQTLEAR